MNFPFFHPSFQHRICWLLHIVSASCICFRASNSFSWTLLYFSVVLKFLLKTFLMTSSSIFFTIVLYLLFSNTNIVSDIMSNSGSILKTTQSTHVSLYINLYISHTDKCTHIYSHVHMYVYTHKLHWINSRNIPKYNIIIFACIIIKNENWLYSIYLINTIYLECKWLSSKHSGGRDKLISMHFIPYCFK